jgi:hypothetical protein
MVAAILAGASELEDNSQAHRPPAPKQSLQSFSKGVLAFSIHRAIYKL